jgi:hypothetical protein
VTTEVAGVPVVVRERLWKLWMWMALYAALTFAGWLMALDDAGGLGTRVAGAVVLVMGPVGVVGMARRVMVRGRPFLTLTEQGLRYDGTGAFGFIAWDDVTELHTSGFGFGTTMVVGRVRNPAALNAQRTPFGRWSARRQHRWGDFVIHDLTLAITAKQLLKLMSEYWPRNT